MVPTVLLVDGEITFDEGSDDSVSKFPSDGCTPCSSAFIFSVTTLNVSNHIIRLSSLTDSTFG